MKFILKAFQERSCRRTECWKSLTFSVSHRCGCISQFQATDSSPGECEQKMDLLNACWVAHNISKRARHRGFVDKSSVQDHIAQSWSDEDTSATEMDMDST